MGFFKGSKGRMEQVSTLTPGQRPLLDNLLNANQQPGAGGSFGTAADYYRSLLDDNNSTFNAMAAPEMRRFNEDIIPGLSEQFAGMGSGALSSSGFRNAAVGAGTDLSERLGAIRAQLRQQGAAGLMGLGQQGLGQYQENIYRPGTPGFLESVAPGVGMGAGIAFGGPLAAAAGSGISNMFSGGARPDLNNMGNGDQIKRGPGGYYPGGGNFNPYGN